MNDANDMEEILQQRARRLARPQERAIQDDAIELLEFRLAQERYSIDTRYVLAVHPLRDLTPLPGTPPFMRGVVSLRGRIVPVIDMKKFFDLPESGITDLHRVIFVQAGDVELGVMADIAVGVIRVPTALIQPSPPTPLGIRADYLMGVTEERLIVLDIARVLSDPKIILQDEVEVSAGQ